MGIEDVQVELGREIAALARDLARLGTTEACARITLLGRRAAQAGFTPAAALADGLRKAISEDRRATPLGLWFDALTLAAGCGAGDAQTAPTLLATVGVRMAG
jgi:hypothetical protein